MSKTYLKDSRATDYAVNFTTEEPMKAVLYLNRPIQVEQMGLTVFDSIFSVPFSKNGLLNEEYPKQTHTPYGPMSVALSDDRYILTLEA
jgi:hypothetical protein